MVKYPTIRLSPGEKPGDIFQPPFQKRLEKLLPDFLDRARWFGGKAREMAEVRIEASLPLPGGREPGRFLLVAVSYRDGGKESYLLPLAYGAGSEMPPEDPGAVLALVGNGGETGRLYDAAWDQRFREGCFHLISGEKTLQEGGATIRGTAGQVLRDRAEEIVTIPESKVLGKEQSNTSFLYGKEFILKLYRRPEAGLNPEIEITRFLTEKTGFDRTPPFAGMIKLTLPGVETASAGILQSFVEHLDDGWSYTLDEVSRFLDAAGPEKAARAREGYLPFARRLGERTAQLHRALASDPDDPAFAAEPEEESDREQGRRSAEELLDRGLQALERMIGKLDPETGQAGRELLGRRDRLRGKIGGRDSGRATGSRIRIHGDYHLGQLLYTGGDAVIIDFEGEPARSLEERRRKRSPLVDVAGMVRSFHYAALGPIFLSPRKRPDPEEIFARTADWYRAVSGAFLDSYRRIMAGSPGLLPAERKEEDALLDLFLLEKAAYELNYELNNRPDWAAIPIRGLLDLLT
ncbi:MAG: putative maltokinase [Candidatus Erginobacter occultus]|nr:putative maltokinase [Candidatus Erginobacter occultus]